MSLISTLKLDRNNALIRKAISYAFLGFSIIFIGYLLFDTLLNYPPKMIGISP